MGESRKLLTLSLAGDDPTEDLSGRTLLSVGPDQGRRKKHDRRTRMTIANAPHASADYNAA